MEIKAISAEQTWEIRHKAMWPKKPLSFVKLKNDTTGQHFGLYTKNRLISVISIFITGNEGQFRKFATLPQYQGHGYGSNLLFHIFKELNTLGIHRLWCNARANKISYYAKFGMTTTPFKFKKSEMPYVIMEITFANAKRNYKVDKTTS